MSQHIQYYNTASFGGNLWTPSDASGGAPKWQLTEDGINLSGSDITSWDNDVSGDSMTGSGYAQSGTHNGRTIATFTSGDMFTGADLFSGTTPELDIFQCNTYVGTTGVHIGTNGGVSSPRNAAFLPLTGTIYWDVGGTTAPNRISVSRLSTTWNTALTYGIANVRNSVSNSVQEIYVNTVSVASDATGHSVASTGGFRIGNVIVPQPTGDLALAVAFDYYLGTSDRQKMEGWIAHYIGELGMLPVGHPYKTNPPTV